MNIIRSLIIAFSMFSRIPMPNVKWDEKSMKYMFCFFPFIGLLTGGINILWYMLSVKLGLNSIVFGVVAALISVAVTGGIHIDGFMDTCDALSSHKDREKILEILDDSHVGAFSVINTIVYFLLYFGSMTCVKNIWQMQIIMMSQFVARAVAVCIIISSDTSKNTGLLYTFKTNTNKVITGLFSAFYIILSVGIMESFNILIGVLTVIAVFCTSVYFIIFVVKKFGGVSGDLIGYFICVCELVCVIVTGVGGVVL